MPTRIRLQRHGKTKQAYFHIVIADGRAPRDGKFIERIGDYNPNSNPATINLDFEKALQWMQNGALPSDTCRRILSYKGVMYKYHLLKGVRKNALTLEQAEAKFAKWLEEKTGKITGKTERVSAAKVTEKKQRLAAESTVKESRAAKIAAKKIVPVVEETPATAEENAAPQAEASA